MSEIIKLETNKSPLILVATVVYLSLLCTSCQAIGSFTFNRAQFADAIEQIDRYLVAHVASDEIEKNVDALQNYRRSLIRNNTRDSNTGLLIQLIDQINDQVRLPMDSSYCGREGYAVIRKNNIVTDNRLIKRQRSRFPLQRIELILEHYAKLHAINCFDVYRRLLRLHLGRLDATPLKWIDAFIEAFMKRRLDAKQIRPPRSRQRHPSAGKILKQFMEMRDSIKSKADAVVAVQVIRQLGKIQSGKSGANEEQKRPVDSPIQHNNNDNHGLHDNDDGSIKDHNEDEDQDDHGAKNEEGDDEEDDVMSLIWEYLIDPCRYYVQTFGPDIFMPMQQESSMLPSGLRQEYDNTSKTLLMGRIRFGFCKIVLRDRYYFASVVADVADN